MDSESKRAVEEEVVSCISTGSDARNWGNPAPLVQEVPVKPQQALFEQITEFFRQMTRAIPPLPQQKSPLGKIRKYGAVDFNGRKEDNSSVAEYWPERTERVLQQLHCTP